MKTLDVYFIRLLTKIPSLLVFRKILSKNLIKKEIYSSEKISFILKINAITCLP